MSTYLEVVIQERSKDGRHILTHRHFNIDTPKPGDLACRLAVELLRHANATRLPITYNDPMKPCSVCWQIGQEANRDPR